VIQDTSRKEELGYDLMLSVALFNKEEANEANHGKPVRTTFRLLA
jgi:hypothetical protein